MRATCSSAYQSLPMPTRRTSIDGSPTSRRSIRTDGRQSLAQPKSSPDHAQIDASAVASVGEGGLSIEQRTGRIRFEPLTDDHPLLGTLVAPDEKFGAHDAASGQHALRPRSEDAVVDKPVYVRVRNTVEGGSLFWRADRRRGAEPLLGDRGARLVHAGAGGLETPPSRSSSGTAPTSSTSRSRPVAADLVFGSTNAIVGRDAEDSARAHSLGRRGNVDRERPAGQGATFASPALFAVANRTSTSTRTRCTSPRPPRLRVPEVLRDSASAVCA